MLVNEHDLLRTWPVVYWYSMAIQLSVNILCMYLHSLKHLFMWKCRIVIPLKRLEHLHLSVRLVASATPFYFAPDLSIFQIWQLAPVLREEPTWLRNTTIAWWWFAVKTREKPLQQQNHEMRMITQEEKSADELWRLHTYKNSTSNTFTILMWYASLALAQFHLYA